MPKTKDKAVIVSFRVDSHLADVLSKVPDKSSFIRDIILRSFYETCPICRGRGVLPRELSRWAARQLRNEKAVACQCCQFQYPLSALPKSRGQKIPGRAFVCPHCETHEHAH